MAGTVGPIGFLATQMSFGLHQLFGITDGYTTQLTVLLILAGVYMASVMTGLHKGIQLLSRFNVLLALGIAAVILLFGPTLFLVNTYTQSMGEYVTSFFSMATMTAETAPDWWMKWWTVFFFAWFIGYTPLMAVFVSRISRGRTVREMILAVALLAPIAMVSAGHDEPSPWIRVFWGGAMAMMAAILLYMGAGQIGVLQQFIVITAIPVSLIILPSLWTGPKAAMAMAREQGIV